MGMGIGAGVRQRALKARFDRNSLASQVLRVAARRRPAQAAQPLPRFVIRAAAALHDIGQDGCIVAHGRGLADEARRGPSATPGRMDMKNLLLPGPDSPWWLVAAANLILFLHIAGGTLGIISGFVALLSRKGARVHRLAGKLFFISMLIMATIGAAASPFLPVPEMANVAAGLLTIYLIATSWVAIRRPDGCTGTFEKCALLVALGVVAAGAVFVQMAKHSATGTLANTPPQAFYVFMIVGSIGAAGDLSVIVRGGISGAARIARHLWRMCAALTIACGSFFLGQQKVMPVFMQGSPWLFVPVLAPLLLMAFWLVRIRLASWRKRDAIAT